MHTGMHGMTTKGNDDVSLSFSGLRSPPWVLRVTALSGKRCRAMLSTLVGCSPVPSVNCRFGALKCRFGLFDLCCFQSAALGAKVPVLGS